MVSGQDAETAGIIRNRFVKTEFGREISDRLLNCAAGTGFSVGIAAVEIFFKAVVDLLQFAQKYFVLGHFLQARLPGKLQHPHRIMVSPVPQFRVEMAKQPASGWFPGPPQVERHLPQLFQRGR